MSSQIVARRLVMALMAPDFSLCLFFIPESVKMEEQFKTLIVLSHYLEVGRFRQFWDEAAKSRHIVEVVPGFEHAIQGYAVIEKDGQGRGQLIVLPRNEFNDPNLKKNIADSVPLEHITRILPILS